jgi:ubiquinone/menaquinone biosynthesis C-methylase UbiE
MSSNMATPGNEQAIKQQVQSFYDHVGWQEVSDGVFQNARFEDLRPVSRDYIHRCHVRAGSFLTNNGRFLLDAGSGPIQYPEYLTYSKGFQYRVCADISRVALIEARKRIGTHGLYVVADVSTLPFRKDAFEAVISLHTLHHLPPEDQQDGYLELWRVLSPGNTAVIVNGWTEAPLMIRTEWYVRFMERLMGRFGKNTDKSLIANRPVIDIKDNNAPTSTFVQKFTPERLEQMLGGNITYEVRCWRSVSVRFLRSVIHAKLAGKQYLRVLYWFENRFAGYFGKAGQYPLIIMKKSA